MRNKVVLKNVLVWAMSTCMVSMAAHDAFLKNGGVPTKVLISQLLLILDKLNLVPN